MSYPNFQNLQYFKPTSTIDNFGAPDRMNRSLLLELDKLRHHLGTPVYVTSGFRQGDGTSEHHRGNAVDIVIPGYRGTLLDLYLYVEKFNFRGVGLYRDWVWQGKKTGGIHVDWRDSRIGARWLCYKDDNGVQQYTGLNEKNLKLLGII